MYVLRTFHNIVPPPPTYIYKTTPVVDKIHVVLFSLNLFISEFYSLECVGSNPTSKIIEPQKNL